jgi:hypothetical protein
VEVANRNLLKYKNINIKFRRRCPTSVRNADMNFEARLRGEETVAVRALKVVKLVPLRLVRLVTVPKSLRYEHPFILITKLFLNASLIKEREKRPTRHKESK